MPMTPSRLGLPLLVAACVLLTGCGHGSGANSAAAPGTAPAPTGHASGTWHLTVSQPAAHTTGTTWLHFGDVTVAGVAPTGGRVDVVRDGAVVGHATADSGGRFSTTVANASTVGAVHYRVQGSGRQSGDVTVTNRQPSLTLGVGSSVDAVKPVPVTLTLQPAAGSSISVTADGATPTSIPTGSDGHATGSLPAGDGTLGSLSLAAQVSAPDGTVISAAPVTTSRVARLDAVVRPTTDADVQYTYRAGCPVGPSQLSTITMNYLGFDHKVHSGGVMIVASDLADTVVAAFGDGLAAGFPIKQMVNPNAWHGDDDTMMAADNTSGFNCRPVAGSHNWSKHALGRAVDVNTWENPYMPSDGSIHGNPAYAHSRPAGVQGLLTADGPLTRAFTSRGATWLAGTDWQHFQW